MTFFSEFQTQKGKIFNSGIGGLKKVADPYITGYSFIKFYPGDLLVDEIGLPESNLFFELMEKSFKEVSGFPRQELGTTAINGGFTQNEHMYPSEIGKNITEISLRFQEFTGSPYTREFRKWVSAIRDPETGLYQLSKYGLKYYSVSMLYINTSPGIGSKDDDARANSVEFAAWMTSMYPKAIDYDKYNYSAGDHATNELEQPFACNMHVSQSALDAARDYVRDGTFFTTMRAAQQNIYDGVEAISSEKLDFAAPNTEAILPQY